MKNPAARPAGGYQVSGIRYLVSGIRYQVLVLGISYWNQVSLLESHEKLNRQFFWLFRPWGALNNQSLLPSLIHVYMIHKYYRLSSEQGC